MGQRYVVDDVVLLCMLSEEKKKENQRASANLPTSNLLERKRRKLSCLCFSLSEM
jgi:hypothetical protein